MKPEDISPEEAMKQIQRVFKTRGTKALDLARKEVLGERIECREVRDALTYFMTEYWHDVARPALLSLVCEAIGADPELITPVAVPMILISGAIDIHDDIIDQSKVKYGRSTVYGKFGKDIALLVGDALLFKGFMLLNQALSKGVPAEKKTAVENVIKDTFFELGDAEAIELTLRRRLDTSPEKYLEIVRKKAADVEAHTRISVILGGGSKKEIEALGKYGRLLGMLIILRDDWIDMTDFEEAKHRMKYECLPLPILYALQNPQIKPKFHEILQKKAVTREDVETLLKIVEEGGGLKQLEELMQKLVEETNLPIRKVKWEKKTLVLLVRSTLPLA